MAEYILDRNIPNNVPVEVIVTIPKNTPEYIRKTVYRRLQMSTDRNARVLLQENRDTRAALDIAQQMEMASTRLLRRVSSEAETVVPLIVRWRQEIVKLNDIAKETCEAAEMEYRMPRTLMNAEELEEARKGDKERREKRNKANKANKKKEENI